MGIQSIYDMHYEKTLCFTGHRPDKLGGYNYRTEQNLKMLLKLRALICRYIERRGVHTFISGMALGLDMWSAQIILSLKEKKYPHINLVCAIPCDKQYIKWSESDIQMWKDIVSKADFVHYVSEEPYTAWCMNKRNEWMVDNSSFVLSVWDGSSGGTFNCVEYALKRQRTTLNLHPKTLETNFIKTLDNNKK